MDKKILLSFFILFFLGLFFSFSSTSSLAGERLNKDYYFFFTKHLVFTFLAIFIMIFISLIKTEVLMKLVIPLFFIILPFSFSSYFWCRSKRSQKMDRLIHFQITAY